MTLSEMNQSVEQARAELRRADMIAEDLARLLIGRLRRVGSAHVLKELKRELSAYNMQRGIWRDEK